MPWEIYIIRSQEKNLNQNREKFEPEPGFEPHVIECRVRNSEVRGSNPGSG